ncbi:hypothetical protein CGRA01v4_12257 [Colletotrichum graminicola]|uniref:Uncharacterized protein n=1 Tax=Colletotrichum graminicola (strain M1.001 / M2 / FGSC 10212) TaxID=645133 RepID=E3QS84_COLGM|nr:uncharacterized protein GLRG_08855 [Colletotrichum graminicola M1.001]EFQ33711.1 hypothetical protein GLRG_08855 [Colletotrichum graminicola M1.001]WDK20968.1 hypothetical protein CGRA01v4_12257 [Colletotrichum graminicola]
MTTRALVIGGTSGIGYAMACRVAASSPSSSVVISGRTQPDNMPHANMEFRPIEATSMREIKGFTDNFKQQQVPAEEKNKLDLLIMTQGVMTMAGRTETPEGIDRKMALHYYGKQLLIRELMPALKEDARVVIVYDSWTGNMDKVRWDDLDLKTHFSLGAAANHCQVMNDVMVQWYAARQQQQKQAEAATGRHFVHAWPGGVNTEGLMREMPWVLGATAKLLAPLITVTPAKCAEYLMDGVDKVTAPPTVNKEDERFWHYIDNKGRVLPNKPVCTEEQMGKIADHTWKLIDAALEA